MGGGPSGASPPSPPLAGRGKCRRGRERLESVVRCVVTWVGAAFDIEETNGVSVFIFRLGAALALTPVAWALGLAPSACQMLHARRRQMAHFARGAKPL